MFHTSKDEHVHAPFSPGFFLYNNGMFFLDEKAKSIFDSVLGRISRDKFLSMLDAAVEGVKFRGKSTTGEQTMLDAMVPALEAMKAASGSAGEILAAGLAAAQAGVENTKGMIATKGRASYLGERSLGHQDPGATSFALLLSVIAKHFA